MSSPPQHTAPTHPPHLLRASNLHRHLRTNNFPAVQQHLSESNSLAGLLVANRIGWTALHFAAASHGSIHLVEDGEQVNEEAVNHHPDVGGVQHAQHVDQFGFGQDVNHVDQQQDNIEHNELQNEDDGGSEEIIPDGGWWRWLLLQILKASAQQKAEAQSSSICSAELTLRYPNPFLRRTEAGMTPTDLFFCGHVRPLPWQRPEVHEAARRLRHDMKIVCGENGLISLDNSERLRVRMRDRVQSKMQEERKRQQKEKDSDKKKPASTTEQLEPMPWDDSVLVILVSFWHDMELLLMVAYHGTMDLDAINSEDGRSKWRVVHALAHTGCPPEVARLAVALYPEQVSERDENDNLPLHVAVQSRSSSSLWDATEDDVHAVADVESLVGDVEGGVDAITGQPRRRNNAAPPYTPCTAPVIKTLLSAYPHAAACADGSGRLPLNLALASGRTWRTGIRDILAACPDALFGTRDPATHLFPFMLAAIDHRELQRERGNDGEDTSFEETDEEVRAKKEATAVIGGMWRFMSPETKERVLEKVRRDIEIVRLDTLFEILRAMPDAVRCGII